MHILEEAYCYAFSKMLQNQFIDCLSTTYERTNPLFENNNAATESEKLP